MPDEDEADEGGMEETEALKAEDGTTAAVAAVLLEEEEGLLFEEEDEGRSPD